MMSGTDKRLPTLPSMEVGYYFICPKKLWWFAHGVQMDGEVGE